MSMNSTPSANRIHIGFFGCRNAGKSSLVNAVTNQDMSVVSDIAGTTTDPVKRSMELLPLGPVEITDTPGYDDEGTLGELRIKTTKRILNSTDIAVLVIDSVKGKTATDEKLLSLFRERNIPYITVYNKSDIAKSIPDDKNSISVSTITKSNIDELKNRLSKMAKSNIEAKGLLDGIVNKGDTIVLVIPIDSAAPKGRLILPQQQTIRAILDLGAVAICTRDSEYIQLLSSLPKKPDLVICDSQVFKFTNENTPPDVQLTSFSIIFARFRGDLELMTSGASALDTLDDNDTVLISEGCTHHRQCDDIGTVKIPALIKKYTSKDISFEFSSGNDFSENLQKYKMIIHCGACMLNEREMKYRIKAAAESNIPITNYGVTIAYINGILKRSISVFPELKDIL